MKNLRALPILLILSGCGLLDGLGFIEHPTYRVHCVPNDELTSDDGGCTCFSGSGADLPAPTGSITCDERDGTDHPKDTEVLCCAEAGYPAGDANTSTLCSCDIAFCRFEEGDGEGNVDRCVCDVDSFAAEDLLDDRVEECSGLCCKDDYGCACYEDEETRDANCDGDGAEPVDGCTPRDVQCGGEDQVDSCSEPE